MTLKLPADLDQLKQLAETNPKAQFLLAWFYLPEDVNQKMDFVDERYREYSFAGIFDDFTIGDENIEFPITHDQHDLDQAFDWLKKAAESDFEAAYYPLAYLYFDKKLFDNSEELAKKSEDYGFREACFLLGKIYFSKQQYSSAHEYYAKALNMGTTKAFGPFMKTVLKGNLSAEQTNAGIEKLKPFMLKRLERNLKICHHKRFFGHELNYPGYQEVYVPEDDEDDKQFENSLERIQKDYKWMVDRLEEAGQKISNDKTQLGKDIQHALEEKEREMLSFFTHTMRNALATAPEALRQAIQLLGSDIYEKDSNHYKAINKMTALFSSLSLTDSLIDTFKQSIADPQEFKKSWGSDNTGKATPKWVVAAALRQGLNRILFMSDTTQLRVLLDTQEVAVIKASRKSFIDNVLPLNLDESSENAFLAWVEHHTPKIEVKVNDTDDVHFGASQTRFSLLFAITSELILNALKYWDGQGSIRINWQRTQSGDYAFSVTNHCQPSASSRLAGTHKGLAFIKRLIELLGTQSQFDCQVNDQVFTANLILNRALLRGES